MQHSTNRAASGTGKVERHASDYVYQAATIAAALLLLLTVAAA
ncbi:MAG TPA: hypothetical protein VE178_19275 [Silvibacterium sp.]|jgi:hypothetical protein|nr:hypothetical protein [Silvibacterium sp.]